MLGGLHRRGDHASTLTVLANCISRSPELATKIEDALWEALGDEDRDVQWGAARALIENHFWEAATPAHADNDDEPRDWSAHESEATRRLDALMERPDTAPVVAHALNRALWAEEAEVAWSSALFLQERQHSVGPGILRALVFGGLLGYERREAETRLRKHLSDASTRDAAIEALTVGMFSNDEESTPAVACLLVEAGAPMHDRIVTALDALVAWQPWIPLALLALTNRQGDAVNAATQIGCNDLLEALGPI